ncbi:MAG: DNA-binding protein [Ruminococcaceae bacterium]|nr:DNA-binding protein [Oscillospiraceae bacterium]
MKSKNLEISVLCDIYSALLPEKQKDALDYYYNEDLSLSEIAEHAGISRQGVRDQIKHAEAQLMEFENALHLYEKMQKTERLLNQLSELSHNINNERLSSIIEELRSLHELQE